MENDQILVVALGHDYRKDDGFGAQVLRALQAQSQGEFQSLFHSGDATDLLEIWTDRSLIILDACESLGHPGRLHVLRPLLTPCFLPETKFSTHGFGLSEAIALGELLGSLPRDLTVLTVEGQDFSPGAGLSEAVSGATEVALSQLKKLILKEDTLHA